MDKGYPINAANSPSVTNHEGQINVQSRPSVISNDDRNGSANNRHETSVICTPNHRPPSVRSDSSMSSTQPLSQPQIVGPVALTPTHSLLTPQPVNPHSSMAAVTPMASGTTEAKNSIKIQ